nr:MAG: hypothetical protein DIU78_17770 [Pseudomonadota bacterium]
MDGVERERERERTSFAHRTHVGDIQRDHDRKPKAAQGRKVPRPRAARGAREHGLEGLGRAQPAGRARPDAPRRTSREQPRALSEAFKAGHKRTPHAAPMWAPREGEHDEPNFAHATHAGDIGARANEPNLARPTGATSSTSTYPPSLEHPRSRRRTRARSTFARTPTWATSSASTSFAHRIHVGATEHDPERTTFALSPTRAPEREHE